MLALDEEFQDQSKHLVALELVLEDRPRNIAPSNTYRENILDKHLKFEFTFGGLD